MTEPLFNPVGGYASYVVPAAFVLILQQTLLMGSSMLGGVTFEAGGIQARRRRGRAIAVAGQALAHLCLAMPGVALYLIILPRVYGFSTLGRPLDLFLLATPFLLSVSLLGQFVGSWFTRRENAASFSLRPACRCSSWSGCLGRSKPSQASCARRARSFQAPQPSTGSCASIRWAPACSRSGTIG